MLDINLETSSQEEILRVVVDDLLKTRHSKLDDLLVFANEKKVYFNSLVEVSYNVNNTIIKFLRAFSKKDNLECIMFRVPYYETKNYKSIKKFFNVISMKTQLSCFDGLLNKKEFVNNFYHEIGHVIDPKITKYNEKGDMLNRDYKEVYADTFATLIYIKNFGYDKGLFDLEMAQETYKLLTKTHYGSQIGVYYSAHSMLAAKKFAENVSLENMNLDDIANVSSQLAKEYTLSEDKRVKICKEFDMLGKNMTSEEQLNHILNTAIDSDDNELYRVAVWIYRGHSYPEYSMRSSKNLDSFGVLRKKGMEQNITLNPIEEGEHKALDDLIIKFRDNQQVENKQLVTTNFGTPA